MSAIRVWPQLLMLMIMFIGIGISLSRYGEQKRDKYDIVDVLIGPAFMMFLLYEGGFFDSLLRMSSP